MGQVGNCCHHYNWRQDLSIGVVETLFCNVFRIFENNSRFQNVDSGENFTLCLLLKDLLVIELQVFG